VVALEKAVLAAFRDASTPGWALKSAIRQGAGRQANRSRLASRRASVASTTGRRAGPMCAASRAGTGGDHA
jgi:hypothetical protein